MKLIVGGLMMSLCWWWIWRLTTGPEQVSRVFGEATGSFLEIGLYKDYPGPMLSSLRSLNRASLKAGLVLLPPSLLFLVPAGVIAVYLWACLPYRALQVGEPVLVELSPAPPQLRTEMPPGLSLEAGPVKLGERAFWRVRADAPGTFLLSFEGDGHSFSKTLEVRDAPSWVALNPVRERGWWGWLRHPFEKPTGSFQVRVHYPRRPLWLGTVQVHWALAILIVFLLGLPLTRRLVYR